MAEKRTYTKRKAISIPVSANEFGKLPPNDTEIENVVIGVILGEKDTFSIASDILFAEMFYCSKNALIFTAAKNLEFKRMPIDALTVIEELRKMGELENAGNEYNVWLLCASAGSNRNFETHCRIIYQKYLAREIIRLCAGYQNRCYDDTDDIKDIIESLETEFTKITTQNTSRGSNPMKYAVETAIQKAIKTQHDRESGASACIDTGFQWLNTRLNGGFKSSELIILGARPSVGKSQFALHFAQTAARNEKNVLFVSIEMSETQLVNRFILQNPAISSYDLQTGQMSVEMWNQVEIMKRRIQDLSIHIADGVDMKYLNNIRSEARRLKRSGELDMMIIDYLGLINVDKRFERRQLEIAHITGELKSLTKELDVPIILLSQLNRPEKGAKVPEPKLHDLRESGDIEQDADMVLFLHRPHYHDNSNEEWKNKGKLILAKNREGVRNENMIFHHDDKFKNIWEQNPKHSSEITPAENFYERENKDKPF